MRTNTIYNVCSALLAAALILTASYEVAAQSSTRRNNSGSSSTDRTATVSRSGGSGNRAAVSNPNDRNGSNFKPVNRNENKPNNNGNVTNRPNNNGNVTNRPNSNNNKVTYKPNNKPNNNRIVKESKPKGVYITSRDKVGRVRVAPRVVHRPAPVRKYYDFGYRYTMRPANYYKIRVSGIRLYFWDGVWYRYRNGYYGVYRPPVGTVIPISYISSALYPVDFEYDAGYGTTYYVDSYANFYIRINGSELRIVNAPDGAVLYNLPSDYSEVVYNGFVYYRVGNSIFEKVRTPNGSYFCAVGLYR